jgi:hypothetical protein
MSSISPTPDFMHEFLAGDSGKIVMLNLLKFKKPKPTRNTPRRSRQWSARWAGESCSAACRSRA